MIKSLLSGLVFSNLFVATILSLLTAASYDVLPGFTFKWYVPLAVFFGTFLLYAFHRLYKVDFIPKDQLSDRHLWALKREGMMKIAMTLALFALMLLLPNYNADTVVWLVPAAIVSVGYTIPMLPTKTGWQRFRDVPFTKPLVIAVVVTYITLCFPAFEQAGIHSLADPELLGQCAERMLFLLAVTLPFDLRDISSDRSAGLHTLGTDYGLAVGRKLGLVLIAAWVLSFGVLYLNEGVDHFLFATKVALAGALVLALVTLNEGWDELRYVWIFEGSIGLYALCYLFFG